MNRNEERGSAERNTFLFQGVAVLIAWVVFSAPVSAEAKGRPFAVTVPGPETLRPLDERGLLVLRWEAVRPTSRFTLKPLERPLYRVFIAPEKTAARQGRVYVTYDTWYPFTNLEAGRRYRVLVDVEQTGRPVLPETVMETVPVRARVKWYVAPRAEGGDGANPGTYDRPKDVDFACAHAGPGDVVVLKSGVYFCPASGRDPKRHDAKLHPGRSGARGNPVFFLAESNDVSSSRYVSFRTAWGNIYVNRTDYVVFDGIDCDADQGKNAKALTAVFSEYGHRPTGVILRNTWYRAPTSDKQVMVNGARFVLVENCFFAGSTESHNVYLCNNTQNRPEYGDARCVFRNNIAVNATRNNVHANGFFDNFVIENNVFIGAKVANISLATVHRNTWVRNNIAYAGAKQAITLNFYNGGVPLEDRTPCRNIHICHNTLIVPDTVRYPFAAIIVSDGRRDPNRHAVEGLYMENNILACLKADPPGPVLNFVEARHLAWTAVRGNVFFNGRGDRAREGAVRLPAARSGERSAFPVSFFEAHWKKGASLALTDRFLDAQGGAHYAPLDVTLRPWTANRRVEDPALLFRDLEGRDFRLPPGSPAAGAGVEGAGCRRVIRDIYGNIRSWKGGRSDAGAVAAGAVEEGIVRIPEIRLHYGTGAPAGRLRPGVRALAASARLRVQSAGPARLREVRVEFEVEKADPGDLIDAARDLKAELVIRGKSIPLAFYKKDERGNAKIWPTGHAFGLDLPLAPGEAVPLAVYLTPAPGKIRRVETVLGHDDLWAFDARGWKLALTGMNELHFSAAVE